MQKIIGNVVVNSYTQTIEGITDIIFDKYPLNQKNPTEKDFEECRNLDLLEVDTVKRHLNGKEYVLTHVSYNRSHLVFSPK